MVLRAVILAAVFSFAVLILPARGLTFLWDDWPLLLRTAHPATWFEPINEHWKPLYAAAFALEHAVFGANHTLYLVATWAVHVLNLALLGTLLERKTGDARAAAIAVLAFGVATSWREVLWWAGIFGLALCFSTVLLGYLAALRAHESRRALMLTGVASFVAPLFFGSGLVLGPALALELAPKRRALVPLAGFALYAFLYLLRGHGPESVSLGGALIFIPDSIGLGFVDRTLLVHVPETVGWGMALALVYFLAVLALSLRADRGQLARAQAYWILLLVPIALARSTYPAIAAGWSRYQYFPGLAWSWTLALALTKRPRAQLVAVLLLIPLALGHAIEARRDERPYAPASRRDHPAYVKALIEIAHESSSSLDAVRVPIGLAMPGTSARDIVRAVGPDRSP
jgi:hypothetical protein